MNFFLDKDKRRKSPIVLVAFGVAIGYLFIFGVLYALLAEPLYHAISFSNAHITNAVHSLIIAVIGTAVCSLLFLLKDKRIVPYGFAGLLVVLCMFYFATILLDTEERSIMLPIITAYGLAPVLVGNAVTWPIYLKFKRVNPAQNNRKTIQEELREAVKQENARKGNASPAPDVPAETSEAKELTPEEMLFGPDYGSAPPSSLSAEEEAMSLYEEADYD